MIEIVFGPRRVIHPGDFVGASLLTVDQQTVPAGLTWYGGKPNILSGHCKGDPLVVLQVLIQVDRKILPVLGRNPDRLCHCLAVPLYVARFPSNRHPRFGRDHLVVGRRAVKTNHVRGQVVTAVAVVGDSGRGYAQQDQQHQRSGCSLAQRNPSQRRERLLVHTGNSCKWKGLIS